MGYGELVGSRSQMMNWGCLCVGVCRDRYEKSMRKVLFRRRRWYCEMVDLSVISDE